MYRIIDLSWPMRPGMPAYPGDPPMRLDRMGDYEPDGYLSHLASLPTHSGTHVDAPAHVLEGGAGLADLPLAQFFGPAVMLDLTDRKSRAVTAADLAPHQELVMRERPAFVLLRTGDSDRWGTSDYYPAGTYLEPQAAQALVGLSFLSGIGLDAGSVDPFGSRSMPAHRALLSSGLIVAENLRGLGQLPPRGFVFLCLPLLGLDGSPARAAALLE